MLISELPDKYRKIAEKRREECTKPPAKNISTDILTNAFVWSDTPEGDFWKKVHDAERANDLPTMPEVT